MSLDDKVALITGGTRGIGFGIAEAFVREGANVVLVSRNKEKGGQALAALGNTARTDFVACDATKRADIERAIDHTVARYGRLDILVNNVGGADQFAPVAVMSDEMWERGIQLNATSAFIATRKALEYMLPRSSGASSTFPPLRASTASPSSCSTSPPSTPLTASQKVFRKKWHRTVLRSTPSARDW